MTRLPTPTSPFGVDTARLAELVAREAPEPSASEPFRGLRAWRDRLDTILRVVTDGVVVLDFTGAVVYANAPACGLLDVHDPSLVLGHGLTALFARRRALGEDGAALSAADLPGSASRSGEPHERLVGLEAPGEPLRWAVIRVAAIEDAERRAAAVILVLRDVTEARRAEDGLRLSADAGALLRAQRDVRSILEATARLLVPRLADVALAVLHEPDEWSGSPSEPRTSGSPSQEPPPPLAGQGRGGGGGENSPLSASLPPAPSRERAGERSLALASRQRPSAAESAFASCLRRVDGAAIDAMRAWCTSHDGDARLLGPESAGWPPQASALGLRACIVAPFVARDRRLGVLLLASERRAHDALDLEAAADVARRAALALDVALTCARLEEANRRLSDADRKKDEFLAILAHELRNPLTPLLTTAELLRMRGARADLEALAPILERQAKHMARLVEDLLDVSRIKHGKIELRRARTELGAVIDAAIETCAPLIEAHRHALTVELPEALALDADPLRLTQVFGNLLHNAAKYTGDGGRIAVRARAEGERAIVIVEDDGAGISAELLPRVFDLFAQDHGGRLHGLGVGLHMVRTLVDLHGGAVEAHSDGPGRGSRFTVTLPGVIACADPRPRSVSGLAAPKLRDALIVDDDADVASVLDSLLARLGCETRVAHDGPSALALARERAPDLVILDIGMPGMSGYEVARELRAMGLASTRVVALSGYAQPADRRRALEAGCDLHLAKPAPLRVLAALVSGEEVEE